MRKSERWVNPKFILQRALKWMKTHTLRKPRIKRSRKATERSPTRPFDLTIENLSLLDWRNIPRRMRFLRHCRYKNSISSEAQRGPFHWRRYIFRHVQTDVFVYALYKCIKIHFWSLHKWSLLWEIRPLLCKCNICRIIQRENMREFANLYEWVQ